MSKYGNGEDFTIFTYGNRDLTFYTVNDTTSGGGNAVFFPNGYGNMAIGKAWPNYRLDISGDVRADYLLVNDSVKTNLMNLAYLNPTLTDSANNYSYVRFGNTSNSYSGFMWNKNHTTYGDGDDFSLYTYDGRDIAFRTGTGNVIFQPNRLGGKVGIGTTNPQAILHIEYTIGETDYFKVSGNFGEFQA